jgi:hypothetical protein
VGPSTLIINHQIMFDIWSDLLFWESAPSWEMYRELAELEVAAAEELKSSLSIKNSDLYNAWITKLLSDKCEDELEEFVSYVRRKRKYRPENLALLDKQGRARVISFGESK